MGMPKGFNELFYQLLRLSLGLSQEFPDGVNADDWRWLYQMAVPVARRRLLPRRLPVVG